MTREVKMSEVKMKASEFGMWVHCNYEKRFESKVTWRFHNNSEIRIIDKTNGKPVSNLFVANIVRYFDEKNYRTCIRARHIKAVRYNKNLTAVEAQEKIMKWIDRNFKVEVNA